MGTTRLKTRRRSEQGFKWSRIAIAILSTVGVIDTGTITLNKWGFIGTLSCPGGIEGCNKVLNSAWGTLLTINETSIPLSLAGFSGYLLMLVMALITFTPWLKDKRSDLSKRTWWLIFLISCSMSIFSIVLIGIMVFKIQGFCLFCIISGIISISILVLSFIGGGWEDTSELIFRGIILSLIVFLGSLIWASSVSPNNKNISPNNYNLPPIVQRESNDSAIELAKHLKDEGAKMYFAYWCKYCALQKELFGKEAVSELLLVECAEDGVNNQSALCKEKGITSYPSWEINGEITSGAQSLEELAKISNYKGSKEFK
ncbi:vitamin K epoxide reductase family protein [Prochlorococcus sp. MIT 1223]|uniref:vitamin K epoxide reductase family protein n=1 Tax=Prochlorococcus sp. MIT 1223 TaxID=3096217 RepID=UPI002A7644BF|nr:vitamin K epoxide reductase family protein [Prochlorococcus sp. MIT 1223]